jgi:hypothetical protein
MSDEKSLTLRMDTYDHDRALAARMRHAGEGLTEKARAWLEGSMPRLDRNYVWTFECHWNLAVETFSGMIAAAHAGQFHIVEALGSAIDDLYDKDRAAVATSLFGNREAPVDSMPRVQYVNGRPLELRATVLTHWSSSMPTFALANLSALVQRVVPDELLLATYEARDASYPDPVIYARFGNWYVKVAEWE